MVKSLLSGDPDVIRKITLCSMHVDYGRSGHRMEGQVSPLYNIGIYRRDFYDKLLSERELVYALLSIKMNNQIFLW